MSFILLVAIIFRGLWFFSGLCRVSNTKKPRPSAHHEDLRPALDDVVSWCKWCYHPPEPTVGPCTPNGTIRALPMWNSSNFDHQRHERKGTKSQRRKTWGRGGAIQIRPRNFSEIQLAPDLTTFFSLGCQPCHIGGNAINRESLIQSSLWGGALWTGKVIVPQVKCSGIKVTHGGTPQATHPKLFRRSSRHLTSTCQKVLQCLLENTQLLHLRIRMFRSDPLMGYKHGIAHFLIKLVKLASCHQIFMRLHLRHLKKCLHRQGDLRWLHIKYVHYVPWGLPFLAAIFVGGFTNIWWEFRFTQIANQNEPSFLAEIECA